MEKRNIQKWHWGTLVALGMVVACGDNKVSKRNDPGSSLESLDNLAAGQIVTVNSCDGAHLKKSDVYNNNDIPVKNTTTNKSSEQAVYAAMRSLPLAFGSAFKALDGTILITNEARTLCQNSIGPIEDLSPQSCWYRDSEGKVSIVFPPDEKLIKHAFVRTFAYMVSDLVIPSASVSSDSAPFAAKWKVIKQSLAEAFLKDTSQNKALTVNPAALAKLQSAGEGTFANYIMAESFDSYYCSAQAQSVFKTSFPNTWNVWVNQVL